MAKILITDTLFFFKEHEQMLKEAGYEVERLEKPDASEEELAKALKDKVGYLLGGVEHVTEKVLDAATELKAIGFTGIDYTGMIPAWEYATKKGVAITNTPSGPTNEASEWAVTAALTMSRHFLELGRVNPVKRFLVTEGLEGQKIGIVGLGRIGSRIAELIKPFNPSEINYNSRTRQEEKESELGVYYLELAELLETSDVVFLCVAGTAKNYFGKEQFDLMKKNALLVSVMHPGVIEEDSLFAALRSESIRAISDYPMKDERFKELDLDRWYCMNTSSTITHAGAKLMSDTATTSLLNILKTGEDEYLVNPDYKNNS